MSQRKPEILTIMHNNTSKVNSLTLTSVVLLAIAVSVASAEGRNGPERIIEKPSSRAATAFVPRLGKRFANSVEGARLDSLGRLLCANSLECNQLVLLGALVRGIAVQNGDLNLVPSDQLESVLASNSLQAPSSFDSINEDGLKLLRMLHRDQLLRRDTRASADGAEELMNIMSSQTASEESAPKYSGAKRVAFTPRIGRR